MFFTKKSYEHYYFELPSIALYKSLDHQTLSKYQSHDLVQDPRNNLINCKDDRIKDNSLLEHLCI